MEFRTFARLDRGQYGDQGTLGAKLMQKSGGNYWWKAMVFLVEGEEAPSLTLLGESIARAFNVVNKKEQNADRFELGEAVSVDLKPLSYHIEEKNATKILRNLLHSWDRQSLLQDSSILSGFYESIERGVEILQGMNDDEYDEYLG